MLSVSAGFLAALAAPQRVTCRADVTKGGVRLFSGLPVLGGEVEVDAGSITRRRLTLDLAPRLSTGVYTDVPTLPRTPGDPLGNFGQEITVHWGLTYPDDSTEWLPAGVFRIDTPRGSLLDDGPVRVTGVSREAFVADARFTAPRTASSPSATSLIGTLIHEVLPGVEVVVSASMDRRVPTTTWDEDRWGAITDLAESIAAVVYADPYGRFVVADAPTVDTAPVWRVAAGRGGVLVSAATVSSRTDVYNGLVVRGESPSSDSPPVIGAWYDLEATSPTRWGDPHAGAWGMRPRFMYLPTVTSSEQATAVARASGARYVGAASSVDLTAVPNAALEALDVIDIVTDPTVPAGGSVRRHVVDSFRLPLTPGGSFPMTTRDLRAVA